MLKKETIGSIEDENVSQNHILFNIIFEMASIEPLSTVFSKVSEILWQGLQILEICMSSFFLRATY